MSWLYRPLEGTQRFLKSKFFAAALGITDSRTTVVIETDSVLPPELTGLRGVMSRRAFMPSNRLIVLALAINIVVAVIVFSGGPTANATLAIALTAATVNLGVAALIRQQYVVNFLFFVATRAPLRWPLRVRSGLAKVYHIGGIHIGCAISATFWFFSFASLVTFDKTTGESLRGLIALHVVVIAICIDFLVITVFALPVLRERSHDIFEATHRYGGWLALVLFGALVFLFAAVTGGNVAGSIADSVNTWILLVVVVSVAIPWLQLRKVTVDIDTPSDHVALARFDYGARPAAGSFTRIAGSPLGQSHSFATIPAPGSDGYRVAISKAGDWTGTLINAAPEQLWVRGVPTAGVATVARLFSKVVWIATGSGIAPCIPHLLTGETPAQLVWVTRNPERTYGKALVDEILTAQPDAIIWDTDSKCKPDLAELAYRAYRDSGAEAIICISNKRTTFHVVTELAQRGVPAFGPIWDS